MIRLFHETEIKLFQFINQTLKNRYLDKVMPIMTHLGGPIVTILISLYLLVHPTYRDVGLYVSSALTISHLLIFVLKKLFGRLRPFDRLDEINVFPHRLRDHSFPSGHATAVSAVAFSLSIVFPSWSALLYSLVIITAVSRIYLGVHYPSDVLAGILVGAVFAYLLGPLFIEIPIVDSVDLISY